MQQQSPYHGLKNLDDAMAEGMERFQSVSQRFRDLADMGADQATVQREAKRLGYAPIAAGQDGKMVDYTDMVTRRADMTVGEHLQDVAAGFGRGLANLPADVASLAAIPFQAAGYDGVSNFANKYREGVNELIPTSNKYRTSIAEQVGGGLSTIAGAAAGGAGLARLGVKGATAAMASRGLTGEALAAAQRSTFASLAAKKSLQLMTVQGAGAEAGAAQAAGAGAGATILAAAGGAATAQLERFGSVKILGEIFGAGSQAAGRMTGGKALKSVAGGFAGEIGEEVVAAPISTIARSGYETDPFSKRLQQELEGTLKVAPLVILPFTAVHGIRASQMVRRDNELAKALPSKLAPKLEGVAEGQILDRQVRTVDEIRADNPELADQLERVGARISGPDGKPVKLNSSSAATQRVQALGEAITESGARVVYFEPEGEDAGDVAGFYDKDTATIFINSKQSENVQIMQGMFHELLHDIYQDSPGGLTQIHERLQQAFGDNYTKFMQKVANTYKDQKLTESEMTEEYVNNFLAQAMPGYMAMAVTSKDMFKMAAYRDPGLVFDISRILSNFLGRSMDKYTQREQAILAQRMENIANELQGDFAMDPNAAVKVDPMTAVRVAGEVSAAMQQALELRSQAIPEIRRALENPDVEVSPEGVVRRPVAVERTGGGGVGGMTFSDRLVSSSVASEGVNDMASKLYPGRTGPKLASDVYEVVDDPTAEGGGTKLRKIASAGDEYTPQIAADVKDAVSRDALYGEVKFDSNDIVINLAKRVMRLDIPAQYRALGRAIQKVAESTDRFAGAEADVGVDAEAGGEALAAQVAQLQEQLKSRKSLPAGSPERRAVQAQLDVIRERSNAYRRQTAARSSEEIRKQSERVKDIVSKMLAAEAIVKYGQDYSTLTDEQKNLVRIDAEKRLAGFTGVDDPGSMRMPFMRDTSAFRRGFNPERAAKPLEQRGEEASSEAAALATARREAEFEREYSALEQEEKLQGIAREEEQARQTELAAIAKYEQQFAEMEREEAQRTADIAAEELAIMQEMSKEEAKPLSERQGLSDQQKVAMYLMAREVIPTLIAQRKRLPRNQQPPNLRQALKEYFALEDELRRKYPDAEDWKRKRLGKPTQPFQKPTPRKDVAPKKGETALQAEIRGKYGSDLETLGEEQRLLADSRKAIASIFKAVKDKADLPRNVGAGAFAPVAEFSKRTAGARSTTGGQRQAPFTSVNGRSLEDIAAEIYTDHTAAQKLRKNRGDKVQVARLEAKVADNLKLLDRISNTQKARINKISDIKREVRAKSGIAAPTFGRDKAKPAAATEAAQQQPAQEQTQAQEQAETKPAEATETQQQQEQEQTQEQEQQTVEFDPETFEPSDDALEVLSSEPTLNEAYRAAVAEAGNEGLAFFSGYLPQDASDKQMDAMEVLREKYEEGVQEFADAADIRRILYTDQLAKPPESVVAYRVDTTSGVPEIDVIAVNVVTGAVRLVPRQETADHVSKRPDAEVERSFNMRLEGLLEDYRRETRGERQQQQQQDEEGDEEAPAPSASVSPLEIPGMQPMEVFSFGGRVMAVIDIDGQKVPFYRSSGKNKKPGVSGGLWYPFMGVTASENGEVTWIAKTSDVGNFYGIEKLKQAAEFLNNKYSMEAMADDSVPNVAAEGMKAGVHKTGKNAKTRTAEYLNSLTGYGMDYHPSRKDKDGDQKFTDFSKQYLSRLSQALSAQKPAPAAARTGVPTTAEEQIQAGIDFLGNESTAGRTELYIKLPQLASMASVVPLPGFGPSFIRVPSGPDGKPMKIEVMYMLINWGSITPSHTYSQGKFRKNKDGDINERPYDDPEAGKNLRRDFEANLENFDPAFVLSTDNTAVNGPPVITARGVVLGGNSRAMMLQSLSREQRDAYEKALKDTVSSLPYFADKEYKDFDPFGGTVLVRVIKPGQQGKPGELSPFLNESFTASREVNARATSRGARLKPETASQLSNVIGDLTMRGALGVPNKSVEIQQLLLGDGVFTERELDALRDKKGQLTDQGRSEVEMAVLGAVVNDVRVMSEVEPSTMQKIVGSVAPLLRIMAADPSSRQSIENAIDVLNYMKANDIRLDELDRQQFAFTDKQAWRDDQLAKDLAAIMSLGKLNAAKALSRIAVEAEAAGTNQGDIFAVIEPGKPKLSAAETVREEARQINSRDKDERAGEAKTQSGFKPILSPSEIPEGLNLDLDINIQQLTDMARSYEAQTDPLVKSAIESQYNRLANLIIKKVKDAQAKNKDKFFKPLYESVITKVTQRANVANHPRLGDGLAKKGGGDVMFSRRLVETEDERLLRLATRKPEELLRVSSSTEQGRREGAGAVGFLNSVYENAVDAEAALREVERKISESADAQAKLIAEGKLPDDVERYNYNSAKHAVSDMLDLYRGRIGENNKIAMQFRQDMIDAAKKHGIPITPEDAADTDMVSAEDYLYATHAEEANKAIAYDRAEERFDKSKRGKDIKKEIRKLRSFVVGERGKSKRDDGKDPDFDKIDEALAKIQELEAERDAVVKGEVDNSYVQAKAAKAEIAKLEADIKLLPKDSSARNRLEVDLKEQRDLLAESTKDHSGSGMTDEQAREILDRVNKSPEGTKLNGAIAGYKDIRTAMTGLQAAKLKIQVDSGLVDPDTADKWRERYGPNYVPLKSTIRPPDGNGFGSSGFSIKGKETESRKGRATLADDLIGHSLVDFSHANSRAMKNLVMNSFVRLAESNSKLSIWTVVGTRKDWEKGLKSGLYDERDNRRIVSVKRTQTYEDPFTGELATRTTERIVLVNDEGLARALTQMDGIDMGSFTAGAIRATRLFTKMQTAWNPAFILPNFARDVLLAVGIRYTDNGLGASRRLVANIVPALRTILAVELGSTAIGKALGFDKMKAGKFDLEYRELRNLGGFSSPVDYGTVTEQMDRLRKESARPSSVYGKAVESQRNAAKNLFEFVEAINTVVERATRLAAYVEFDETMAQDAATSGKRYMRGSEKIKRAAATKNLTVNFDRRGRAGHILNSLYAFYNANAQGTANLIRRVGPSATPEQRMRAGIAIAFLSTAGYAMSLLARAMGDDDEQGEEAYKGLAADELQKNMVIMLPGAKSSRLTVPLPWGMNMAYFAGVQMERLASGQIDAQTAAEEYTSGLLGSFSPITGPTASLAIVPTLARPFAEITANMNYAGNTIMPPVDPYDKTPLPDSRRAYRTVGAQSRWVAETLNDFTGGDERTSGIIDVSPESIEHIAEFMSGGAGRFVQNAFGLDLSREERQIRDIPVAGAIAGRFVRESDTNQRTITEYYANTDKVARLREDLKDPRTRSESMSDPLRAVDRYATAIEGKLRKLKDAERRAQNFGNAEMVKNLSAQRIQLMQSFNRRYNQVSER